MRIPAAPLPKLTAFTVVPLLALLAACGQAEEEAVSNNAGAPPPTPDSSLVLRVDYSGGFVTPQTLATRLPLISVYADGRVITTGPQVAIYPGPALPNLQERTIDAAAVQKLVQLALDKGVGTKTDLGEPSVSDMPSTRFTVVSDGTTHTTDAYALVQDDAATAGLTGAQKSARADLLGLVDALTDLDGTLGRGAAGTDRAYVPDAVAATVSAWVI